MLLTNILASLFGASSSASSSSSSSSTSSSSSSSSLSANLSGPVGYAPVPVKCPLNVTFLRKGDSISPLEKEWIAGRHKKTDEALVDFLSSSNLTNFDAEKFVANASQSLNMALAFSGGGYRAMLNGAGQLSALDNRTEDAVEKGLGGILQASTYVSGLSGGAWLVGSLAIQDWPSVQEVVFENPYDVWNLTETRQLVNMTHLYTITLPVVLGNIKGALSHLNDWAYGNGKGIGSDVESKANAGFLTSITDYWARALAHQLFQKGNTDWNAATQWSDIRDLSSFSNHDMPFPLVSALGRAPGSIIYNTNNTVVEFNPYEMGSYDPSLNSFTDVKYIGSNVTNGKALSCISGFDNAGFVIGTSSSLFNQFLDTLVCDDCDSLPFFLKPIIKKFLNMLSMDREDVALYKPNPFYQSQYAKSKNIANNDTLYLIDGGLAGETIPLSNLMTKERALDVVFAYDNDDFWSNGSSIISTYERQFSEQGNSTLCPYVPDSATFGALNLTAKPTFFGCDASNMTELEKDGVTPPLVIYIANRPFEFFSNTSTFQLSYTDQEKKAMIRNGFDVSSRINGTIDTDWKTCVSCALIRREQERQGIEQSDQCKKCFQNYCWDGSVKPDPKYQFPVNFTLEGLTNDSMKLWGTNVLTPSQPPSLLDSLF